MRFLIFIIVAHFCVSIFGQQNYAVKSKSIGLFYSPNIAYRNITGDSFVTEFYNDHEFIEYGQSTGFIFRYSFCNLLGLESGLNIKSRGFQYKDFGPFILSSFDTVEAKGRQIYKFYYLGVPLKITLHKDFQKISLISSIGIEGNYLLRQKNLGMYEIDGKSGHTSSVNTNDYEKIILTSLLGLGIDWRFSNSMKISVMPTFHYDILPIVNSHLLRIYLWDLGLQIGIIYEI